MRTHDVLLTRPLPQSRLFAAQLRARFADLPVTIAPLIEIITLQVTLDLTGITHLLFTSVNGVNAFVKASARRDIPCLCVGDRSADLARGFGLSATSAKGNQADLLALALALPVDAPNFLHIHGQHVAGSLVADLRQHNRAAKACIAYEQIAQSLGAPAKIQLQNADLTLLPLFSPRSAKIFMAEASGLDLSRTQPICLSQNVAHELDAPRFEGITLTARPDAKAMVAALANSLTAII